jgi:hypothetical protein
MSSLSGGE